MSGSTTTTPCPDTVWRALARPLAARRSMRLWHGPDRGYDQARTLATATRPQLPAALPLFDRDGRAHTLGLDFDAKHTSAAQVAADVADAVALITQAGGRVIVDVAPSGGRHVWVPLWAGHRPATLLPLLRAMRRRWRSLDITPMTNPTAGCLTGPGSACIGGGHRTLLTPLPDAMAAAAQRSAMGTLGALRHALGILTDPDEQPAALASPPTTLRCSVPLPASAHAFATGGVIPAQHDTWTRSEARLSVLVHTVRSGMTRDAVEDLIATRRWNGMADAYAKYSSRWPDRLEKEWAKATELVHALETNTQHYEHKQRNTGGYCWQRTWLAQALAWVGHHPELTGRPQVAVRAVLQALSYISRITGERIVAPGGRWLSIAAGLLAETTVWATLRDLSSLSGSPLRLARRHRGPQADHYELTTPTLHGQPVEVTPDEITRVRTGRVHPVWSIIGHCAREIFEIIDSHPDRHHKLPKREIKRLAHVSASTVDNALAKLSEFTLITTGRGWVERTDTTLDQLALDHDVDTLVARRVERHRAERRAWWTLLAIWEVPATVDCPESERLPDDPMPAEDRDCWLLAVMSTGPPPDQDAPFHTTDHDVDHAEAILRTLLGAAPVDVRALAPA